jgi:hypothetical protein
MQVAAKMSGVCDAVSELFARFIQLALVGVALSLWASPSLAGPVLQYDDQSGMFQVKYNTATVATGALVFWRGDWSWFGFDYRVKPDGNGGHVLAGPGGGDSRIEATARQSSPLSLTWDLKINPGRVTDLYGGLSFNLTPANSEAPEAETRILPGNAGWEFVIAPGEAPMRVTFDPAPKELFFERGGSREIRAYFIVKGDTTEQKMSMTVTMPEGGKISPNETARLKKPDPSWQGNVVGWTDMPVDLSFLNEGDRPAGKRGFVKAVGDKLVFADGTPARFWGTNVTSYALFNTLDLMVPRQAKRLAALGFNLVRIHHHDSAWVGYNVFGINDEYTGKVNEAALNKIDWWVKCLKDEGIYVWLDMHVGREFGEVDRIRDFDEIAKGKKRTTAAGFNYINPDIEERMKEFQAAYMQHVNKFTGVANAAEPAIVGILITNENDITNHYGNSFLPNANVPNHSQIFMKAAAEFAVKNDLDADQVWRTWLPGPSKLLLNDIEHTFNRSMIDHLRGLGVKAPIVTTNSWGEMSLSGLPALTDGDMIDVHVYGKPDEIESNPRFVASFPSWIAAAAVVGKPVTASEWNLSPFPAFDRAGSSPYLAAIASLQGWSGLMQYAYGNADLRGPGGADNWTSANDPAFLATYPSAALLYRQGHVAEGRTTYLLDFSPEQMMGTELSPATSRAIRTITETGKLRIAMPAMRELPWLKATAAPEGAIVVKDPNFDAIPAGQTKVCSDTGELCRDWETGVFTVDTPLSEVASGWIGGRSVALKSMTANVSTPYAVIALQSLDAQPIPQSGRLLLSMTAQSRPAITGQLPYLSEPVEGTLTFKGRTGLKAYARQHDGSRVPLSALTYNDGTYTLELVAGLRTFWIELAAD